MIAFAPPLAAVRDRSDPDLDALAIIASSKEEAITVDRTGVVTILPWRELRIVDYRVQIVAEQARQQLLEDGKEAAAAELARFRAEVAP